MAETYVVFDVETTGLDAVKNEIIQLGAVKLDASSHKEIARVNQLVKPVKSSISYFITNLTGISNQDVYYKPQMSSVLPDFIDFLGDSLIVGHNVSFDMGFLEQAMKENGLTVRQWRTYDTYAQARLLMPRRKSYKLESFKSELDVSDLRSHDAFNDVLMTARLYQKLLTLSVPSFERPSGEDSVTFVERMRAQDAPKVVVKPKVTRQALDDGVSADVRRLLGLPITKSLIYWEHLGFDSWKSWPVKGLTVESAYTSGFSLAVKLDETRVKRLHSDFFKEMQKPDFIKEMEFDD